MSDYYYKDKMCRIVETVMILMIVGVVLFSDYVFREILKPVVRSKYLLGGLIMLIFGVLFHRADIERIYCYENSVF
jgi:hypothetical protein